MHRRVTPTNYTAGPLQCMLGAKIGLSSYLKFFEFKILFALNESLIIINSDARRRALAYKFLSDRTDNTTNIEKAFAQTDC